MPSEDRLEVRNAKTLLSLAVANLTTTLSWHILWPVAATMGLSTHMIASAATGQPCFFFSSRRRHTRSVSAFLLNRSSDLTAISIFVCLSMVQLMAVFISMRCTLCGHFLQVALTLILVVGYAIAAS